MLQELFSKEAKIGGYVLFAAHAGAYGTVLLRSADGSPQPARFEDPLLNFGANNYEAILSPIGIVHLYRQYFFEFAFSVRRSGMS